MDWMSESGQVNLAHVTKKQKYKMNKLKQTPVPSAHLIRSRSNILEDSPNGTRNWQEDYGGKAMWNRYVVCVEKKTKGVIDGKSEGEDCEEVMCAIQGEPGGDCNSLQL